jgi:hypothetical protein
MATRGTTPAPAAPTCKAMKMYRNYDGARSTFGDQSVSAAGSNPDVLSTFAALRSSDGALTIMVISKALSGNTPVTANLAAPADPLTATSVVVRAVARSPTPGQAQSRETPPRARPDRTAGPSAR